MTSRVTPTKALRHLDRVLRWTPTHHPAPTTIEWDLSNRCSLKCHACHFGHTHVRGPWTGKATLPMAFENTGDLADITLVKRGLQQASAAGVLAVVWSGGGEPTLHPQWTEAIACAHDLGLKQGMYTLGGHLTQISARVLRNMSSWVVVSLDAASPKRYAREKSVDTSRFIDALRGIEHLVDGKAEIGVSFMLHAENWDDCDDMVQLAKELGATYATLRPLIETDASHPSMPSVSRAWVNDALPFLRRLADDPFVECDPPRFEAYRDWTGRRYQRCYGIRLSTVITPDGRVWLCPQRRGVTAVGDLNVESFEAIWARHPGVWSDFDGCRTMCRLHLVNEQLAGVGEPLRHEAFV